MNQLESHSVSQISGEYVPPGDKSISHRLAMLGALASGTSTFSNFLNSDDCLRTIKAFETMSVQYDLSQGKTSAKLKVKGAGLNGLKAPSQALDLGNSGTTMRLLLGILAGQPFETSLTGDPSLSKRPMRRVTEPLRKMGARIKGKDDANYAPLTIQGGHLKGIHWRNEVASAQVKSAILLAGLFAEGETSVEEPIPSRDHTERLLKTFGVPVFKNNFKISVRKANRFDAIQFVVPGDISSAAFFMVAALLIPGSELFIRQTGLNPTRIGLIRILKSMGADITLEAAQDQGEPIGNIHVKASRLKGITIEKNLIPSLIDELPILMIACALAEGA